VAVFAAGTAFPQAAPANPQPAAAPSPGRLARLRPKRLARILNVTGDQKQQVKSIVQQARQTAQPVRQQIRQNRQALAAAVTSGQTDAQIQQLAAQQGNLLGQMVALRTQTWARIYGLLTPDQRAQAGLLR